MMSEPSSPTAGAIAWVELSTSELERAIHFYERLLGWHFDEVEREDLTTVVARTDQGEVGGISPRLEAPEGPTTPPSWTVFLTTGQLSSSLGRCRELGGSVLQPQAHLASGGVAAVVADPSGATFGLVEPSAQRPVSRPAGVAWVECLSRDVPTAQVFYCELLGWKAEPGEGGYILFARNGEQIAGLMATPREVPSEAPSTWLVYFGVEDAAQASARAAELGGNVLIAVRDINEGRFAILSDPSGAVFAVFEPAAPRP